MGNAPIRRDSIFIESSIPPTENVRTLSEIPVEIFSDAGSSGTTTPPVVIEMIASGKEDSETFISQLNKKLTEEHRQIIQKIEADVDTSVTHRHSQDSQTDGAETASVASAPVTRSEYKHVAEKQGVLSRAEDAQKSLDKQVEEISALRTKMLGEYEQMLSVRAEVMASQSEEVSKLQEEMAQIQQQYENQMAEFQSKVQSQTETALKSAHEQELEEMKQYYETKVADMEESYTTDIAQLKQEHAELLARLQQESGTGIEIPSPQSLSAGQHREYVRRTTMLTAISDEDMTPESTPPGANKILEGRIYTLEEKLKDKETLVKELKGRLEAEATSAEDLHGKLLDSNKTLDDFEESLKSKSDEIEELKKLLINKDEKISKLEKAALEEKGEKDKSESGSDENKIISELKERIKKLEEDLSASKEANARIQQELNDLDSQHGEAIMQLKEEMEILNKAKIAEIEAGFQIQLEEELKQQADELDSKYREELSRQTTEELEIYKRTEIDLRQKLNSIQKEHESQIKELKEKFAIGLSSKEIQGGKIEMVASPTETLDKESLEASLRKDVESSILQEYEQSIDKLKNEYEERISDMNARLKSFETQDTEKAEVSDREKDASDSEEEMREKLKAELALEFKDKLQSVTDEYESKLKTLQDIVDSKKEIKSPSLGAPYALSRSRSLDLMPQKEKEKPKSQTEYEGYVSTIRREYEDKINSLQMQIAQYRSTVGSVPSSPLSTLQRSQVDLASGDSPVKTDTELHSIGGFQIKSKLGTPELRQEIYDEIASEFEASFKGLRTNYEKQLEELTAKLELLQSDSGSYDNKIRQEIVEEYEAKIEKLKQEYEAQIRELKSEHETEVLRLNGDVEKAKSEVLAAQQKVKADMFVWHEETVTQLKRKHEAYETQIRKEYEEKMELYREELQEGFDAEKDNLIREHKQELLDLEDRYDNLVEGLRTGEVPEVAEIVQEKFDMELEMAKTLIQQECDETIEAEQTRLSEQFDSKMKEIVIERDREQENQRVHYEKEMADLRNTLLQQYEAQVVELESQHKAEMIQLQAAYEKLMPDDAEVEEERVEKETVSRVKAVLLPQGSIESTHTEEGEKDEDSEKVTSMDSTSDKSDKDTDDDDDKGDGKGGARASQAPSQSADSGDKHEQEREGEEDKTQDRDESGDTKEEVSETMIKEVKVMKENTALLKMQTGHTTEDSAVVDKLREELAAKIVEYESSIAQMKLLHEEEIRQLTEELSETEAKYQQKVSELEESHEQEVKDYQDTIQKLREGLSDDDSDSEALELAHQQELRDLEERLLQKHMNELNNLETQHQSRLDDMAVKYKIQIEDLQKELVEAQRAIEQYPDTASPTQTVPVFHGDSTMGSTKESTGDFMVPTGSSRTESERSESHGATMETQIFDARDGEDRSEEEASQGVSLIETLEEVGVQSLDTSVIDTSMDQSRGTLRGVDTTQDTELIQFSEEEESDKSMEEGIETHKSDRSTPVALMQTLGYGAEIPGDPTVKSLDDTTDSSIRASDKEEMASRIRELEAEVDELRGRLQAELSKQDDQMERMDREKQEESNLTAMLRGDIERLNSDRDAIQGTNEHLLGLLSDAVKTYMGVEESITKKMKVMMEKSGDKLTVDKGQVGTVERKKTPPPGRKSPATSPGRLSPARADDGETADTSIVSNVTDEGLDLSQHISDSIFQGPELKTEEEELLTDSGSRLRSSVSHLLEVMEETTNQLLETRQSQSDAMDTLEGRGHDLDQLTSRCNDLEERLKEEVERKDFLALELHKAEGLIEGYSSERESLDERIRELEEDKETLVLELETTKNKLLDLESIQTENLQLKKEMEEQRELMTHNVGEEAQALMLEVTRLNSENREKDEQIKQVHERYESRMRELETSGEDMETHLGTILEDKKQEAADLKLHVEALEKQLKAKKQFIEEQSAEREQEHEEYQKELKNYKQIIHDLEKQNGTGSRLQTEIDDLTEQLQARIDLHNQALLESEKFEREIRDKDLSLKELKTIIQQLEQDLQDKIQELEQNKQKLKKLEEELARRSYDEDLSDSKSDVQSPKPGSSLEFDGTEDQTRERPPPQMTVEEEMRQAANKTKEELVREKFTLQSQVNDNLVQISSLRNQLDDMRHRRGMGESPDANKRLEFQREKSEEKDKLIAELKLRVEELNETIENRDQQIEQLRERKLSRGSPVEGIEFESDREVEKQIEALKRENKQLRERVKLSEASSITDISGLSQNLLEEKNQEIDHLSEQVLRLQSDYNDLKAERGVQNLASIQQEMEESEASRLEKMMSLESELVALRAALNDKEEYLVTIQTELSTLKEDLQGKDEMILALQSKPEQDLIPGLPDDVGLLQSMIQEKEELVTQLTVQVDSLQAEVDNLSDFQYKLQEDFDTVQTMLEEKDREIESLTKELTDRSPTDDHSLVIKHEVEIVRLKKDLREKDNVVEEKLEELAEMTDKVELLETEEVPHSSGLELSHISKYKEQVREYDDQILAKERELKNVKKQLDAAIQNSTASLTADEKDKMITEKTIEIERLNKELETAALGRPPSPPLSQDEKSLLITEQKEEIMSLKEHVQKLLGRPPSPPLSEDEKSETIKKLKEKIVKLSSQLEAASLGRPPSPPIADESSTTDVVLRLRTEIEKLKQQIMDANLSEDDKYLLIRDLRLENETLKKQIDAALKIRPPSPPMDDDEKSEHIYEQKKEIESLKSQLQSALKIQPPPLPKDEDEKSQVIQQQELIIAQLKSQVETLQVEEAKQFKMELESQSSTSVKSVIIEKDKLIKMKSIELEKAEEKVQKLEEELESAREVRAYEDEIQLKEKEDEIEELQAELESYRSRSESTFGQSIDLEMSLNGGGEASDSKQLVKSLSFYKEQYEEKCSEARQVQVQLDLVKQQLEKARSDKLEDAQEEIELFKAELERKNSSEVKVLKTEKENIQKEKDELIRELDLVKERLDQSSDEQVKSIEKELQLTKDELARERMDSVQAINDLEKLRERKEKERRGSIKTIQELEHDLEEKVNKEKELSNQIRHLSEELNLFKKQYGIEEKGASGDSSRTSPKSGELRSQGSFELGTDVDTLQQQVLQFKQQSDKAKEILSEKQKYQSQVVKLEIQQEQLQKKMKKEVGELEEKLKAFNKQPDYDVWEQLNATQEKLEKTTEQLTNTGQRLNETDANLNRVSADLASREADLRDLQQELWKTSGQLSVTSGRLQETEEKLRQTIGQLTEREEQIHQLQGELQHTQHEVEKVTKKSEEMPDVKPGEVEKLRKQLKTSQTELEAVKKSLNEAVDMSEQQLQMVENKDQEYVKLKLDIQQTLSDKEKTIRDQRNKLKEKEQEVTKLKQEVKGKEKEVTKIRQEMDEDSSTSTIASLRSQLQKVMNLKDELSNEHQRHIEEMTKRAHHDTETQLATMRIKYTDEIEHIKRKHSRELEEMLHDQKNKMERKHKSETNKLILKHQEEVGALKLRAGEDIDDTLVSDRQHRQRQEGVGADHGMMNGHGAGPMSHKLQGILQRLHSEGVQVLTISELELLNRSQSQVLPRDADIESMQAGWENERQTMLSTIQSLKDLLSQTHKLRGLDKDDDDDDDLSLEGSDWRAELLRAIGYVFTKERETLLAELRSHVLSHPSTNLDETQRLEQKIRTMESHHHAALDQIFNADRQSMLAEIRDLRAHATIARMHHQEERDRLADKVTGTEDLAVKKERQLKREVQLLEFKIQQEKVLQDDLRTSLDSERNRSGELSSLLNQEKTSNLDLQTSVSALQTQVSKLRENLEREQSRYVSVTNALEEEKSKSLNLSDLLESERETLWRVQAELEALKQQQVYADPRAIEQLQADLNNERERRCQADSQHEIDMVTMENLRQEVEMGKRRLQGIESELGAKVSQLQRNCDMERQKITEINRALDRERSLSAHLQQSLEAEKSTSERNTHQDQSMLEDLHIQLETERANLDDLNRALQREQRAREEAESEKSLIKDHLNQERALNEDMKHDLDKLQFERLEAVNQLQKEREMVTRIKSERDQINDELRKIKSQELQTGSDREAERLASKKSVRDADRQKEEYRMKLHEQELETQRLSQKITGMQEQLAESQENELKAIRELEQLKIETMHPEEQMVSVQTSPRPDFTDGMSQEFGSGRGENWHVYRSQLESMCQSLHYLILRCREQLNKTTHSGIRQADLSDYDALQKCLRDLLSEVKQLQEMEGEYMTHPSGSVNERILRQNEELTNFVARISEEKTELRNTLGTLEEEIWRYRQMDSKYQEMQRSSSGVDHQLIAERSDWAKEKLSLQMALNSAEREIDLLQTDLRVERERRVAAGITETKDNDKIKIQRLYGKYLRAESFRKALIYQKKYLLILLGGFQDTEETTLALLSRMGAMDSNRPNGCRRHTKPLTTFRGAVRVVIAIQRMKFLVKKWRRATRVGSEVVGGTVDQNNGYVPHSNGYSPARSSPRVSAIPVRSASSSPARAMSYRHQSPSRATENAVFLSPRFDMDSVSSSSHTSPRVTTLSHVPYTPPTKDYSSTTKYSSPSSGARRKILTSTSIPAPRSGRVRFTSDEPKNGELGDSEDYIHRLENLQTRLGTLQNGRKLLNVSF